MTGRAPNLTKHLEALGPFDPDAMTLREARAIMRAFYREHGAKDLRDILSTTGKMQHSEGVAMGISLRPGDASGWENCTMRTEGCTLACVLETSYRGRADGVRDGRDLLTEFLAAEPQAFVTIVAAELRALVVKHGSVAFRPNIASDNRWEFIAPKLFDIPGVRGYDYTKWNPLKHRHALPNYRLTYSVSEHPLSEAVADAYVKAGGNAAVVVASPEHPACTRASSGCQNAAHIVPEQWRGFPAVNGDATDDRTTDPAGTYVILWSKADGRADRSGFVKAIPLQLAVAS